MNGATRVASYVKRLRPSEFGRIGRVGHQDHRRRAHGYVSSYAAATRCPVLTQRLVLATHVIGCAMSGTDLLGLSATRRECAVPVTESWRARDPR
eukprot:1317828-Rhodomonas_salina.1